MSAARELLAPSTYRGYVEMVREASPVQKVLAESLDFSAGAALCPFHPDNKPSLNVNTRRQFFRCFGCGVAGDVFRFVELKEGLDFREAVTWLARRAGLPKYNPNPQEQTTFDAERLQAQVLETVATYYAATMTDVARRYFTETRGLPGEFLKEYLVGWAAGGAAAFIQRSMGGSAVAAMVELGLATPQAVTAPNQPAARDHFRERLMLPCLRRGRATYLSGRRLDGEDPKYLNQRGVEAPLYNADRLNPERTLVTEGQLDALSLEAWGYPTVGLLGGGRTQVYRRLQQQKNLVLVTDADRAGRASVLNVALALGLRNLKVVRLPAPLDPNDVYRTRSKAEFEEWLGQAVDPIQFWCSQPPPEDDPFALEAWLDPVLRVLAKELPITANQYLEQSVAPTLGWTPARLQAAQATLTFYREGATLTCPVCRTSLTGGKR